MVFNSEAGTHRYKVATEMPIFCTTSFGREPEESNCLADSILLSVIFRLRPPIRPLALVAAKPALVLSAIFRLAEAKLHLEKLEAWILRHLRCIQWRQWKKPKTRFNKLISFKVNRKKAARVAWGRGGPWFSSATSAMNFALNHAYFRMLGWLGLLNLYSKFKTGIKFL
jgi:hypothetical protein